MSDDNNEYSLTMILIIEMAITQIKITLKMFLWCINVAFIYTTLLMATLFYYNLYKSCI